MSAPPRGRSRFGILLAAGQLRYQVLLLLRSPISTFTALVIPLMVLVALNVATPQVAVRLLPHTRYIDFLTPAMVTFALLNACYVNTITSVVIAREGGVLKRLHGTPLPLWAYVLGRIGASAVVGVASVAVVLGVGVSFLDVRPGATGIAQLAVVVGLGIVGFTTTGLMVSTLVPRAETALPVAYGTMLPIAFVSDVFFPATSAPAWLRHTAADFPLAPIAGSAERIFTDGPGWPLTTSELVVTLCWIAGSAAVTAVWFRWEPGTAFFAGLRRRGRQRRPRRPAGTGPE